MRNQLDIFVTLHDVVAREVAASSVFVTCRALAAAVASVLTISLLTF